MQPKDTSDVLLKPEFIQSTSEMASFIPFMLKAGNYPSEAPLFCSYPWPTLAKQEMSRRATVVYSPIKERNLP